MKIALAFLALAGAVLGMPTPSHAAISIPAPVLGDHVAGELLVGFSQGIDARTRSLVHRRYGAIVVRRFEEIGTDLVRLPPGLEVAVAQAAYAAERSAEFAEPNYLRRSYGMTPNDPQFANQWGLRNTGQTVAGDPGTADADIDASEPGATRDAWQASTGSPAVVVAVPDTGIQITHPDLGANIWVNPGEVPGNGLDDDGNGFVDDVNGWDFAHDDASVYDPSETCSGESNDLHGTHVAGIIGAAGDNGTGVAGINWSVQIMPVKFLARFQGECGVGDDADAIAAILYAARMGASFVNVSWGGSSPNEALRQAFIAASRGGILFSAAAGNGGPDGIGDNLGIVPDYPPSFDLENEIVVAASNNDDGLAGFSNFGGPTDLAAPGVTILSTVPSNSYTYLSGTSMAAPFVTGALALLRSQYPHAPAMELKERLLSTVDPKPAFASPVTQSGGRLNLNSALRQVRPVTPTLLFPNGGDVLAPSSSAVINWRTNVPDGNPATPYRIEFTTDALASTSFGTGFESGIPAGFVEPADSEAPWSAVATSPHPGGSGSIAARSGMLLDDQASWLSTTVRLAAPGMVSFWYRLSSENCETPEQPTCGDYLRFLVDGAPAFERAGVVSWTQLFFEVSAGSHTFSWAYQKDQFCPGPQPECAGTESLEDAAWIDDIAITGVDASSWSLLSTTGAGDTSFNWAVPSVETSNAKVRLCEDEGTPCRAEASDESDEVFAISTTSILETGGSTVVTEGGAGDDYTIVLLAQPTADVTVAVSPDAQLSAAPTTLVFTPANWSSPQTVTVAAVDDLVDEPTPHDGVIVHLLSSTDPDFNGAGRTLPVEIQDNDVEYWFSWYDGTHDVADWIVAANPDSAGPIDVRIFLSGQLLDVWSLPPLDTLAVQYPGRIGGPLRVLMTDPGIASVRSVWGSGETENLEEVSGITRSALASTHYWPWYDGVATQGRDWIHVVNTGNATANVTIDIGETQVAAFSVPAGGNRFYQNEELIGGPVVLNSDQPVLASQRVLWNGDNFSETAGMQLTTDAWFSWYDYSGSEGRDWVVIGNPGANAVSATVTILGTPYGPFPVPPRSSISQTFPGVDRGPVHVTATGQVVVSQRAIWGPYSMEEVGGTSPRSKGFLSWYDAVGTNGREWVLVANVGNNPAGVVIKVAGVQVYSKTLAPGEMDTPRFPGVIGGPVEVIGSSGSALIISRRTLWGPSNDFTELIAF